MPTNPEWLSFILAGIVVGGSGVSLYVKMSLPSFTLKTLNGRYPTKDVIDARFNLVEEKLKHAHEKLDRLLAKLEINSVG